MTWVSRGYDQVWAGLQQSLFPAPQSHIPSDHRQERLSDSKNLRLHWIHLEPQNLEPQNLEPLKSPCLRVLTVITPANMSRPGTALLAPGAHPLSHGHYHMDGSQSRVSALACGLPVP